MTIERIKEFGYLKPKISHGNKKWFFFHNVVLIRKKFYKIFATTPEKFNLPKHIENDILYNFKIVFNINYIENT